MTKLIIWVPGYPTVNGHARGEYQWSEKHQCYIYHGQELDPETFNEVVERAIRDYPTLYALVKAVPSAPDPAPVHLTVEALDIEETKQEFTLADALDLVERLAPHRLKKQPGPHKKPALVPA